MVDGGQFKMEMVGLDRMCMTRKKIVVNPPRFYIITPRLYFFDSLIDLRENKYLLWYDIKSLNPILY